MNCLPRLVSAQNATGEEWRKNSRKNEEIEPKQKQYLVVHVTGDRSNIRSCKEQYCIGTWNVRSMKVKVKSLTRVRLFATPWTIAHQAPLSMGFSRQEYWSELPFPSPGDLPDPGIKPRSPALQADTLTSEPPGKPTIQLQLHQHYWLRYRLGLL